MQPRAQTVPASLSSAAWPSAAWSRIGPARFAGLLGAALLALTPGLAAAEEANAQPMLGYQPPLSTRLASNPLIMAQASSSLSQGQARQVAGLDQDEAATQPVDTMLPGADEASTPRVESGVITFELENDIFSGTDRYYTNGFRLSYVSPASLPDIFDSAADLGRAFLGDTERFRWGLALGQNIYTPQNTQRVNPDPNDRPYAAFTYVALSFANYRANELNSIELQLGMVGPTAGGEFVQNEIHRLINDNTAKGWDYQIKDEPAALLVFDRQYRASALFSVTSDIGVDFSPHFQIGLGNVQTYASTGFQVRLGQGLDSDFGAPRIRPAMAGSTFFRDDGAFNWYLFAGAEGRAVAYDITLDGNTGRDSRSVARKPLVGDLQAGAAMTFGGTRITYSYVYRTEEFKRQRDAAQFGAVSVSFAL